MPDQRHRLAAEQIEDSSSTETLSEQTSFKHMNVRLETLPTELLEQIALNLTYPSAIAGGDQSMPNALSIFRLTSRAINSHVHPIWLRLRCSSRTINFTDEGLEELAELASHPKWSQALRTLRIQRIEMSTYHYQWSIGRMHRQASAATGHELVTETRSIHEAILRSTYLETSGTGTCLLVESLNKLPNLHTIEVGPTSQVATVRYDFKEDDPRIPGSTTTLLTSVLTAITMSQVELKAFGMTDSTVGAAEDAFYLPPKHMERLATLESVRLYCTRDNYKNPASHGLLSEFLRRLPKLKMVHIRMDPMSPIRDVLHGVARLTHTDSVLEEVHLDGIFLSRSEQDQLLTDHQNTLKSLILTNCSLEGGENQWSKMFLRLRTFRSLKHVQFSQLAEDDKRVQFPSTAFVDEFDIHPAHLDRLHHSGRIQNADAWVYMRLTSKYYFAANECENVPARLKELADDVEVTDTPAMRPGLWPMWYSEAYR